MSILLRRDNIFFGAIAVACALRISGEVGAIVAYVLIGSLALFGRSAAIYALALSWLFTMLNPAIADEPGPASMLRYFVIACASISTIIAAIRDGKRTGINSFTLGTLGLTLFLLLHSLIFSAISDVSVLKVISWATVVLTSVSAWQGLEPTQRVQLFSNIRLGLLATLLVSIPLIIFPEIGYARNGSGFQGISSHPQSFGPTIALLGVITGGNILGTPRPRWTDLSIFGLCFLFVVLSEARTAGFAMVGGLFFAVVMTPLLARMPRKRVLPGLQSRRFQVLGVLGVAGTLIFAPYLTEGLSTYIFKRSGSTSFLQAAEASRGELVENMLFNIEKSPFAGIGFGIASDPQLMFIERDAVFDIPISAQVEKGVMPLAVLEEVGVFGFITVCGWFFSVLRRGASAGVSQFAALVTLILVNMGESMFFSVGGMGMLLLVVLGGAIAGNSCDNRQLNG